MSKLKELIEKFCPQGVEFKKIWEMTIWDKKFNSVENFKQPKIITYPYMLANLLFTLQQDTGDVFLLSTGEQVGWTTEELAGDYLCEGEVVAIPWGKSRKVAEVMKYYNGKFVTADNRIATSNNTEILLNKFLFYWMQSQGDVIDKFYRGSGLKHPNMKDVLDMNIPVPPLPVQQEIVRILDNFTELKAELEAELESRERQYIYYREKVLRFENNIVHKPLRELASFRNGKGHEKDISTDGTYVVVNSKFISTGGTVRKFSDKQLSPLFKDDILIVMSDLPNGRALAKCFLVEEDGKYTLNQRIGALHSLDEHKLSTKYLFYILDRNRQLLKYDNGVDQTNLKKDNILDISIPIPPPDEQKRVVKILDTFNTLCSDRNIGLPAEIEARQRQSEYYRDKLLTFKEKRA